MEQIRSSVAALALVAILVTACTDYSEGSCNDCTVYPYVDSPGYDIIENGSQLSAAECADKCLGSAETNQTAIAFVIGTQKDNLTYCWCKSSLQTRLSPNGGRTVVTIGTKGCRYLFEPSSAVG